MKFIAKLDSVPFRAMIDALATFLPEARLHLEEDGLHVRAVDTANVAMVVMHLPREAFAYYELSEPNAIGLDVAKIRSILATMGKIDEVILELEEAGKRLNIRYGGYEYSVALIAENTIRKDPREPEIELPGAFEVPGALFAQAVQSACVVSDRIRLRATSQEVVIEGIPKDGIQSLRRTLAGAEVTISRCDEDVASLFSSDYLQDIVKTTAKSHTVLISLGTDYPMRIEGDYERVHLKYLLAPRIENE